MLEGVLVKAKGGFYFVRDAQGRIMRCRARGRLKGEGVQLLVGDRVIVDTPERGDSVIAKVLPRKNSLTRPPVANVDQAVIVTTLAEPPLDLHLLHRIIISAEMAGLLCVLCFNKLDLIKNDAEIALLKELETVFSACGYGVVSASSLTGEGLDLLREQLKGKISVLAGPSGAGKSTLLNRLKPELNLLSGELSEKTGRGRHTTRHVELLSLDEDTLVADTPGFQRLEISFIPPRRLASLFPELHAREGNCRYPGCLHHHEPDCAVKEAVEKGQIAPWRYKIYLALLETLNRQENVY